jgi:hypothetical protein
MALLESVPQASPPGMAIANTVILAALLDSLVTRNFITRDQIREILTTARTELNRYSSHNAFHDAGVVLDGFLGRLGS